MMLPGELTPMADRHTVSQPVDGIRRDLLWLLACALPILAAHFLLGNGYGFHRDELQFLDDARHLAAGFVAYPPVTSIAGRVSMALFGISPAALRLPAALVNMLSLVLVGLLARELGGGRLAQVLALACCAPVALTFSTVLQYNTFDYFAWALMALSLARLLRTEEERWWLAVGFAAGLGILSKYSIGFAIASLFAGVVLLPSQRHHLRSRWFWLGAGVMFLVALPNLLWLAQHDFITLQMEQHIHVRDVRNGRAKGYFSDQLKFTACALPVALFGLVALLRDRRFRLLSILFLGPFLLFALARGRGYYLLPGYLSLYAAGAVAMERFLRARSFALRSGVLALLGLGLAADTAVFSFMFLPAAPVGSRMWKWQMENNSDMGDEIGWPEMAASVAAARNSLRPEERARLGLFAENYGEAGALALYGPQYGLPVPISGVNSFYARGYGSPEPEAVLTVGFGREFLEQNFTGCRLAGHTETPLGVHNGESQYGSPDIYLCGRPRAGWPAFWSRFQRFG